MHPSAVGFDIVPYVSVFMLIILAIVAWGVMRLRSLFAIVMLTGVYSLVSAIWFVALDAVDVAFTEAAVGAGASTALVLGAMLLTTRRCKEEPNIRWGALAAVIMAGGGLLYATPDLPPFGATDSPANTHVGMAYLETTPKDIDVPNIVTAVLASYRGFDTFGETVVIFAAGVAVALLLGFGERALLSGATSGAAASRKRKAKTTSVMSDHHMILRVVSKILIPFIFLYGLYVQFHGDYGPGGGFQAGVIIAVGVILYSLLFGIKEAANAWPAILARWGAAFGVLLYGGVGVVTLLSGGAYLDYDCLTTSCLADANAHHGHHGQHYGILLVELGVLFAVACTMITLFYAIAGRVPEIQDEDW